jgi:transcriptional regulator GlxA family with amidase domain
VTRRLSTDPLGTDDQAVLQALRHMRLGLAEGASPRLPEIARVAGLSPRGLQERFRKALGCSVSQEWLEMRLERAQALLRDRAFESVSRVAAESGFSDSAHLGREMKKRFGRTPTEIRREFASTPGHGTPYKKDP